MLFSTLDILTAVVGLEVWPDFLFISDPSQSEAPVCNTESQERWDLLNPNPSDLFLSVSGWASP